MERDKEYEKKYNKWNRCIFLPSIFVKGRKEKANRLAQKKKSPERNKNKIKHIGKGKQKCFKENNKLRNIKKMNNFIHSSEKWKLI